MTKRKLIILAAGNGTRLGPITAGGYPKPLVGIYDKPCFYYSLASAIAAGYTEIAIIIKPGTRELFETHFQDGSPLGIRLEYIEQPKQIGTANAFVVAADFIGKDAVTLFLGDNIFIGEGFTQEMIRAGNTHQSAAVFLYEVPLEEASKYGVAEHTNGTITSIVEKPSQPKSPYIIPGVYFYDNSVIKIAQHLQPSPRGEYEVPDINLEYLKQNQLAGITLSPDIVWFDTGTEQSQHEAAECVRRWQSQYNTLLGSPEIEAFKMGLIDTEALQRRINQPGIKKSKYGEYLQRLLELSQ
jgi:glucose-1-phosphate thymidylyltransferase